MDHAKLNSCAIIFVTEDIEKTAGFYRDVAGFRVVTHYEREEKFAALYRDGVEIVLVQAAFGKVKSNRLNYGAGFDAYLVPDSPQAVQIFCEEVRHKGARITQEPGITSYGSIEFVFEDVDGRSIGVGCIRDEATFFGNIG